MTVHELADRAEDQIRVIPHRNVATASEHARLDTGDLTPVARRVALRGQNAIELGRGKQDRTGDAVEFPYGQASIGAECLDRGRCDRTVNRGQSQVDGLRGRDALTVAHHLAQGQAPAPRSPHDERQAFGVQARHAALTSKQTRQSLGLAVALYPATRGREPHDGERTTALGQFQREATPHRVADDMGATHADFVQVALEMIGARSKRERAAHVERRTAVVTGERGRDHFVASR